MNKTKNKDNKKTLIYLLSFLIPVVGIILYFIYKKKHKKEYYSVLTISIIGLCFYSLSLFVINYIMKPKVDDWYKDVSSEEKVVTVIGSTSCPHCQEYKPVIKKMAKEYEFKLYFFESDKLSEEEMNILEKTYDLVDYQGHVPFTFIIKDNEYVTGKEGYSNKEATIEYLKENGVIKD